MEFHFVIIKWKREKEQKCKNIRHNKQYMTHIDRDTKNPTKQNLNTFLGQLGDMPN